MAGVPVEILPLGILKLTLVDILPLQLLFFICVLRYVLIASTVVMPLDWRC